MSKSKSQKKPPLGKGLKALLEDSYLASQSENHNAFLPKAEKTNEKTNHVADIALQDIVPNPFQPRKELHPKALQELSDSIKVHGIVQPITVRRLGDKKYQLISGERRWRASKMIGLDRIPAFVKVSEGDQALLEMALIENIQREDLNAIDVALSYQRLISECRITQENLGQRVGKNRATVTNYLRLLKLPPDIQASLRDGHLSIGHAKCLLSLKEPTAQLALAKKVVNEDLSVRATEEQVRKFTTAKTTPAAGTPTSAQAQTTAAQEVAGEDSEKLQKKLSSHFGTKVVVRVKKGHRGEIRLPFFSKEDLFRLLDMLKLPKE